MPRIEPFLWYLAPALVFTGALLRVVIWWQNRSLFHDEANLALNFCEKDFMALFQPLDRGQYAPPLFSLIQKAVTETLGHNERALRLFPLACGLVSLGLFYRIARQFITSPWVLLPTLWVFSFSDILLRYATESKQYGCDLAVALGLITLALRLPAQPFRPFWPALAGAVAVWWSMPAVFVLLGLGLYWSYPAWREKDWSRLRAVSLTAACWLLSFGLYYALLLRPSLAADNLVDSHSPWLLPALPLSQAQWVLWRDLLLSFPYYTAGYTVLALAVGSAGIASGMYRAGRRPGGLGWLLVLPLLACLLASVLRQYSLIPRLLVWAFPLAMLLQGMGWQGWWTAGLRYLRPLWVLLWLAVVSLQTGWQYLARPYTIEEIRPVLDEVRTDFQETDLLYVTTEARAALVYYRECHDRRADYQFARQLFLAPWNASPDRATLQQLTPAASRCWLVYSHVISESARQAMAADQAVIGQFARLIKRVEQPGAFAYLYVLENK
ncbi:MAG: hypothetical protein IT260_15095 [Saprospiraceae bacterium]|nr:hypothetical protein [Saprospiraceae bacterium]